MPSGQDKINWRYSWCNFGLNFALGIKQKTDRYNGISTGFMQNYKINANFYAILGADCKTLSPT